MNYLLDYQKDNMPYDRNNLVIIIGNAKQVGYLSKTYRS